MKKSLIIILTTLFFISLTILFINSTLAPTQGEYVSQEKYVPNEVLVKFKKGMNMYFFQEAINSIQGKVITYRGEEIDPFQWDPEIYSLRSFLSDPYLLHIKIPEFIGTEKAIYLLSYNPNVEYAEKNIIYPFDNVPNDTHFNKLWGLENTGQAG